MLHIGISTACLYPMLMEDALYEFALGGVTDVELFINTHSELRKDYIGTMVEILQRFEMRCHSVHPFTSELETMMLFSPYERRVQDYLEYCRHYFSAMKKLGASVFVVHGCYTMANIPQDLYFERFHRLVELGRCYGITVAQENVARCMSRSLSFLESMKKTMGKEAQFVLDIKQAVRSRENPMELLRVLGEQVAHVHMSDHGTYGDCLPVGKGRFGIKAFLQQLSEVSPDCAVILELYRSSFQNVQELLNNYHVLQRISLQCQREEN